MNEKGKKDAKWYHKTHSLVISFLFIGPFMLPLVWTHPGFSRMKKFIITAIMLLVTFLLMAFMAGYMRFIMGQYEKVLSGAY